MVSALAVLKAGGAFTIIDTNLSDRGIQGILCQLNSQVILTSEENMKSLGNIESTKLIVDAKLLQDLSEVESILDRSLPSEAAYLAFTSDGKGKSKGVAFDHRAFCSSVEDYASTTRLDADKRTLHLGTSTRASSEILMTLMVGGCLCIPSEEDCSQSLGDAIKHLDVNWASLTPNELASIEPKHAPSLQTICVTGEPIRSSQLTTWVQHVPHMRRVYTCTETALTILSVQMGETSQSAMIGKSTTGHCWIVSPSDHNQLLPIGAPGELLIESSLVGRHHISSSEEARGIVKVPSWRSLMGPLSKEVRFFKTGDLAMYRADGSMELLGNKLWEARVQGKRVDVYDVEDQLRTAVPDAKNIAIAFTPRDTTDMRGPQLVAFIALDASQGDYSKQSGAAIHNAKVKLESIMPHHMASPILIAMPQLPVSEGIVDRMRLHKMAAVLYAQEVQTTRVEGLGTVHASGFVEQSFAQSRLWLLDQVYPGLEWYISPAALRIRGSLDLDTLKTALSVLQHRHEILRTTFESSGGLHVQRVHSPAPINLEIRRLDITNGDVLPFILRREMKTTIDLEADFGWKASVYHLANGDCIFTLSMHRIVADAASTNTLLRDLASIYSAIARGEKPAMNADSTALQYSHASVWEKQQIQLDSQQQQMGYWINKLSTSQPAEFLTDRLRPAVLSGDSGQMAFSIDQARYHKLQRFSADRKVTPTAVLLAILRATHFRHTNVKNATFGLINEGRYGDEFQDVVGPFETIQCITTESEEESFESLVQQVQTTLKEASTHKEVPFERIVAEMHKDRDASRHPLVQVVLRLHDESATDVKMVDLETERLALQKSSPFDLEFNLVIKDQGLECTVVFSQDLYDMTTIEHIVSVFGTIYDGALESPTTPIAVLPLLTDAACSVLSQMGLLEIEQTKYPRQSSLVDIFRKQVEAYPHKVAVVDSSSSLTYTQLNAQSDLIAQWLVQWQLKEESLIGVFANRSCETIVAFLGILKAGLAYLPFDIKTPVGRMTTILSSIDGHKLVLLGNNIEAPLVNLEGVQFLPITQVVREQSQVTPTSHGAAAQMSPRATSLAYVMFTSGSTGKPKGVMVEHRAVARLTTNGNMVHELSGAKTLAHMTNIAFDVSSWEIYAAILNGGTLVCIDAMTVLDYKALTDVFVREGVQVANITPALFKQYLAECPETVALLDVLIVGGDRVDTHDVFAAKKIMRGKIVNGYGPTENTGFSTFYSLSNTEECTNGMPIGRSVSNSGAYVMDSEQRIVPVGVLGELVVTGDGLARGYTDSKQDVNRFVSVSINSVPTRAYRTGDYVRYRPRDGQIEFFGRIDGQIKIRGHRIEIGEIEHAIRSHQSVKDAAVVLQQQDNRAAQLVGFVTISADAEYNEGSGNDDNEADHEGTWEEVFDADTYAAVDNVHEETVGRDFIGWASTYDGNDIDKSEMNEWLDDTIDAILNGDEAGSVLEIGTGTGMILFNLKSGLESYVGLEPSAKAVNFVSRRATSIPSLAGKVSVHKGTAADLSKLNMATCPGLVVINSVAQYFPSKQYLSRVLDDILRLGGVKTIFFGDVRSLTLAREFEVSKALHRDGDAASREEMKRKIADLGRTERELLVDPAFFTALVEQLPQFIEHVEILPKRVKATNELSCYRYAAVLHIKDDAQSSRQVTQVNEQEWIDFTADNLDHGSLSELLQVHSASSSTVAVANIPYKKTIVERHVLHAIDQGTDESIASLVEKAKKCPSLSAFDLQELAQQANYRVEISWARQHSQHGGFDAIFHQQQSPSGGRVLFNFPTDHAGRPPHSLTSQPMRQLMERQIQDELRQRLQAMLPPYMVPNTLKVLDQMPVNENGKVDRKSLTQMIQLPMASADGQKRPPETDAERRLQQIWAKVLNMDADDIGLDDSFFRLGGDSIAAMKMVGVARKAGIALEVTDIFRHRILVDQAQITTRAINGVMEAISHFSLLATKRAVGDISNDLAILCGIDASQIEDAYPCTPLQEGLLSLTAKREGSYVRQTVLELSTAIEVDVLKAAWESALGSTTILRTRIVQHESMGLVQVVCKEGITWNSSQDLESFLVKDRALPMGLGDALTRFALIDSTDGKPQSLVWTVHHALYDGWSHNLVMDLVSRAYRGHKLAARAEFNAFVKHVSSINDTKAESFWQSYLANGEFAPFPALPSSIQEPTANETFELVLPPSAKTEVTMSTLIRAALAVVISQYTGSTDVLFGAVVSGRNAPVKGVDEIVGPTIATVPVRVQVDREQAILEYLQTVQQQATEMIAYEQTGLQRIAKVSEGGRDACAFQTLLVVQPQEYDLRADDMFGTWKMSSSQEAFTTYAVTLQCLLGSRGTMISVNYDSRVVEKWLMEKMMHQLGVILGRLASFDSGALVKEVDSLTKEEAKQIWEWNESIPDRVENCVHNVIVEHAEARPEAPAICAWDGEMTYAELNKASAQLAHHLVECGVGPEIVVPLCFEKSMWTVVAILGVLKAGGAFVLLDHALPEARLQKICRQVQATTAVTSVSCQSRLVSLASRTVVLNWDLLKQLPIPETMIPRGTGVNHNNAAYMIFTSGSTGEPKGAVIEHGSYCTSAQAHGAVKNMDKNTRALQFGSYNFAGSIIEILMTMLYGGCVCVLSEEQRGSELAPSIRKLDANWAFMTSTVLSNLTPEEVPCLETICVGGEPIRSSQIREWTPHVHLRQTYGSAETSGVVSSARLYATSATNEVGKATTGRFWLCDPTDLNRLAPVGTPGEIIVEGAVAGREYKGEPEKTAAAFIAAPSWRSAFSPAGTESRFYKTGDLAKYRSDGSIELLGRKDTQIKLRGQRIEVGEIEYQSRLAAPDVKDVAVELTMLDNGDSKHPQLIGFIVLDGGEGQQDAEDKINYEKQTRSAVHSILSRLESVLPHYMVPSIFVPVPALPLTASGKTNRRVLREMGAALSVEDLARLRQSGRGPMRKPSSPVERQMQMIWAQVLNIDPDTIGLDDRFFRLGGDSIAAMKVVGEARKVGIKLVVADIFRHNTLASLAQYQSLNNLVTDQHHEDVVLVDADTKASLLEQLDTLGLELNSSSVQDILPLTSFQETVVIDGVQGDGELCNYFWLDIGDTIDVARFEESCSSVLERFPILRTCFLPLGGKLWQVILNAMNPLPLRLLEVRDDDLDQACKEFCAEDVEEFDPTEPPVAFILLKHKDQGIRLILRASHAQYDGISIPIIFQSLIAAYNGTGLAAAPSFSSFLQYAAHQKEASLKYWRNVLAGSTATTTKPQLAPPQGPISKGSSSPRRIIAKAKTSLPKQSDNITSASLVSAAWAMLLSLVTGNKDVVYGYLVAGRNSALPSVEDIVGPCVNIVPVRAELAARHAATADKLLSSIQKQFIEHGEADSLGYKEIVEHCTDWPAGSSLDSVIQYQNIDEHPTLRFSDRESRIEYYESPNLVPPSDPSMHVVFYPEHGDDGDQGHLEIKLTANSHVMTQETADALLRHLCVLLEKLNDCGADEPVQAIIKSVDFSI